MRKRSKHIHTDSYFYPARTISKCMKTNFLVPVRMQNISTQNMSSSKMSTQKIPNLHVCYTDKSESSRVNINVRSMYYRK